MSAGPTPRTRARTEAVVFAVVLVVVVAVSVGGFWWYVAQLQKL